MAIVAEDRSICCLTAVSFDVFAYARRAWCQRYCRWRPWRWRCGWRCGWRWQFMKKGTFIDNFNPNGGNGGAIANFGDITFARRGIFRK